MDFPSRFGRALGEYELHIAPATLEVLKREDDWFLASHRRVLWRREGSLLHERAPRAPGL
jgi:hypothetical protein